MSAAPGGGREWGTPAVLAAALLWGSIGVLSVGLFRLGVSPWEVAFWRAALSAMVLGLCLAAARREALRLRGWRELLLLSAFGVVSVGVFFLAFQLATFHTSVAVAVVLLYTAPVIVLLGARLVLAEPLGPRKLAAATLVVAGVWATALGAAQAEVRVTAAGVGWGVLSALAYSSYYLFGKRFLPRFGVPRTLFYSLLAGSVVLGVGTTLAGEAPDLRLPATAWVLLFTLAVGTTLVANALYYAGLARMDAGRAAVIASAEPVVAALFALLLLDQRLTWVGWMGVGLVVGGVTSVSLGARR